MTGNEVLKKQLRDVLESLGEEPTQIVATKVHFVLLLTSQQPDRLIDCHRQQYHYTITITSLLLHLPSILHLRLYFCFFVVHT